nr:MAG TPA: hypothetical protein [Ackermannviridae sp.]
MSENSKNYIENKKFIIFRGGNRFIDSVNEARILAPGILSMISMLDVQSISLHDTMHSDANCN